MQMMQVAHARCVKAHWTFGKRTRSNEVSDQGMLALASSTFNPHLARDRVASKSWIRPETTQPEEARQAPCNGPRQQKKVLDPARCLAVASPLPPLFPLSPLVVDTVASQRTNQQTGSQPVLGRQPTSTLTSSSLRLRGSVRVAGLRPHNLTRWACDWPVKPLRWHKQGFSRLAALCRQPPPYPVVRFACALTFGPCLFPTTRATHTRGGQPYARHAHHIRTLTLPQLAITPAQG
ncbi:hypothetical protein VTJ04DRAFT_10645 [Mycothermus thermophilus]|uniref:uncharacterized protein n=1 Tax=Humicola insolens TaxID=85995 RepID=UPI00374334F6